MDLGNKIKEARLEAGLSQKQLCGDQITRNMLSQIENGSAHPSMKTLGYLAQQLGKPISFFLEESAVCTPNQQVVTEARTALALGDMEAMRRALDAFQEPDDLLYEERQLLEYHWHLRRAKQAITDGMIPYGVKLLYRAMELDGLYITSQLRYQCRVLLAFSGEQVSLEADEDALLARARQCGDPVRRLEILAASDDKKSHRWMQLQARALFDAGRYQEAAEIYTQIEPNRETCEKLEICYRELGDYRQAYEYACKQREMP